MRGKGEGGEGRRRGGREGEKGRGILRHGFRGMNAPAYNCGHRFECPMTKVTGTEVSCARVLGPKCLSCVLSVR